MNIFQQILFLIKRITLSVVLLLFFLLGIINSYTLPSDKNMYEFLPDQLGNWNVDNTTDFNANDIEHNNNYSYALKRYKNDNKSITIFVNALIMAPESLQDNLKNDNQTIRDKINICQYEAKNAKIQGFDSQIIISNCPKLGLKENSVITYFIKSDNFLFYSLADSLIYEENGGLGKNNEEAKQIATINEIIDFLNLLDLEGISRLAQ